MQSNRRQFLGSLARGLLLPIGGGAVALAEPAKAAGLQVTQGPLPMSADALRLRSLKRICGAAVKARTTIRRSPLMAMPGARSGERSTRWRSVSRSGGQPRGRTAWNLRQQQPHAINHHTAPNPRRISTQLPTNHSRKKDGTMAKPVFVIRLPTLRRPRRCTVSHRTAREPIPANTCVLPSRKFMLSFFPYRCMLAV